MTHCGPFHPEPLQDSVISLFTKMQQQNGVPTSKSPLLEKVKGQTAKCFIISEGKTQVVGEDQRVVFIKTPVGIQQGQYKSLLEKLNFSAARNISFRDK